MASQSYIFSISTFFLSYELKEPLFYYQPWLQVEDIGSKIKDEITDGKELCRSAQLQQLSSALVTRAGHTCGLWGNR
jgi:hypothetical protein